ncbi:MAG: hypothetical protein R6T98_06975 [Desulfatiglandales bacterium]
MASGSESLPLGEKGAEKTNPGAFELKKPIVFGRMMNIARFFKRLF